MELEKLNDEIRYIQDLYPVLLHRGLPSGYFNRGLHDYVRGAELQNRHSETCALLQLFPSHMKIIKVPFAHHFCT